MKSLVTAAPTYTDASECIDGLPVATLGSVAKVSRVSPKLSNLHAGAARYKAQHSGSSIG